MEFEFAKIRDAQQLAEIDKVGNRELKGWERNNKLDFIKNISNSKDSIIVAKEKDQIIGYLSSRSDKDSNWLWLEDIYIIKKWRQKGIAKKLINKLIKYKNNKMSKRKLVLLTADRNVNIFERLGFKKTMNFMEFSK